jgi:predicted phosphate transport protein (TIGR00153 family)
MRFRLVPTDDRFFDLFSDSARNAEECARRLRELLADPSLEGGLSRVIECERRGDELTQQILHRLDTSFVTPFDREDIHALAEEMDDVVDDMHAVAALMQVVNLTEPLPELLEQADVLVQMAEQSVLLIDRLESMKDSKSYLDSIDQLESEGDTVYRRTLARLFSGEFEALDVLKWKDIVTAMEAAINTLEDISDVVESIILKHA